MESFPEATFEEVVSGWVVEQGRGEGTAAESW